jgi:Tfp pilus assembly protein PilX
MKKIVDTIANDRGSALVVALLVLVLLTLMGISATTTSTIEVPSMPRKVAGRRR